MHNSNLELSFKCKKLKYIPIVDNVSRVKYNDDSPGTKKKKQLFSLVIIYLFYVWHIRLNAHASHPGLISVEKFLLITPE